MYKVIIRSVNNYGPREFDIEWEQVIESAHSLKDAMSKATRWINKNVFKSDYSRIEKGTPLPKWSKQVTWRIY